MLFRRRARPESRGQAWRRLAARLGMNERQDGHDLLADWLDLEGTPLSGPVFEASNTGPVAVYAFDFLSDLRSADRLQSSVGCLLVAEESFCPVPLRLDRQLRSQLAGIRASASGAEVVLTGSSDGFDSRVTVVARDSEAAARLLTTGVRGAALRLLERREHAPTVTVNDRQLLVQADAERTDLDEIEILLSDALSLYAALSAASG